MCRGCRNRGGAIGAVVLVRAGEEMHADGTVSTYSKSVEVWQVPEKAVAGRVSQDRDPPYVGLECGLSAGSR